MNWINLAWPMATGAFLTMALVHLWTGLRKPGGRVNVLFAISAIFAAIYSWFELGMTQAGSPAEFLARLRWLDLAAGGVAVSLVAFVWDYFGSGRKWLGLMAIGVMLGSLIPDLLPVPKLVFLELTGIRQVSTFGGATYTVGEGVNSPWNLIFYGGVFLLLAFVADASLRLWRRGGRRKALLVGSTVVLFYLFGGVQAFLTDLGVLQTPYLVTFCWMAILVVMAWELSNDQLRAEQLAHELHENQERMNQAASAANLALWEWDISRDEVWANEAGLERAGVSKSAHMNLDKYIQLLHPDDRHRIRQAVQRAVEDGKEFQAEFRMISPKGETLWFVARGQVERGASGEPLHMRGISVDITERKQAEIAQRESEERFRQVADAAPVMIWMSGKDKLCHYFNKGWLDYTGRSLEQELGNGWAEGIHPDDFQRCLDIYMTSFDARREFSMQYRLRRKDGQYCWMLDNGVPRYAADGQFLGYIGSCVDITFQKETEELRRELAHVQRVSAMGQLSTALAHEINQPLGAILRNSEAAELFLQQNPPDLEELRAILVDIRRDEQRASSVIERMRSLLKYRKLQFEALALDELVGQVAMLLHVEAQAHHVSLQVEVPRGLPRVRGDRVHLHQVILNLLLNSLDASGDQAIGQRQVFIRASQTGEGMVELAVIDRGAGIPPDLVPRLFEPFFTTKSKGTGIGLSISKTIVELHGGQISAENNPDGGATFRFTLQVAEHGGET